MGEQVGGGRGGGGEVGPDVNSKGKIRRFFVEKSGEGQRGKEKMERVK